MDLDRAARGPSGVAAVHRLLDAVDRPEGNALDEAVGGWIAQRSRDEVIDAFERAHAAIAPIYDASDIVSDPQFLALGTIHTIADEDLGEMRMQGPLFRLSSDVPVIAFTGRAPGADTDAVLAELGYTRSEVDALRAEGSIS